MRRLVYGVAAAWVVLSVDARGAPRPGKPVKMRPAEEEALKGLGRVLSARVVWSTCRRSGRHDIFIMNADGTGKKALTKSDKVDWFPRFSPDGQRVMFVRSRMGWTSERNANRPKRWDIYVINVDGSGEKKIVKDASWGSWTGDGKTVLFSRTDKAYLKDLATGDEELLLDGMAALKGAVLQQPQLSSDGRFLAITLRGRRRETGIWDVVAKEWARVGVVGGGCQIGWFPSGDRVYWVNPSGTGGSEIVSTRVKDGRPLDPRAKYADWRWMDLPGRRSHEYFPRVSRDGNWLVWCATDRGHDHDVYDYEVYCWRVGRPVKEAVRLTFHTGNDRWPDISVESEIGGGQ